ncbi:hypothetical protein [Sneathiella chinensis]|uniref:Uncharacterized protein n=1 Tax=Sneathiella chinensis TaxID=349750 RepID=A0ABQ5U5T4_9PROT|nr:hypothetical protein [Sneathiella chinensis]GLQ07517.1 hypothetical protein GCM10007924_27380 [Sneathiella chinensis]
MFEFPEKMKALDTAPEEFRSLYREADDGFALNEELAGRLSGGREEAIAHLEQEKESLRSRLSAMEQELAARTATLADVTRQTDRHRVDGLAARAVSAARGSVELLLPHIREVVSIAEEGGKRVLRVLGPDGEPRVCDNGAPFSLEDLVEEMKVSPLFNRAFEQDETRGGGMNPAGGALQAGRVNGHDQSQLNNRIEEIAAGKVTVSF